MLPIYKIDMAALDIVIPLYNSQNITPKLIQRLNEWRATIDFDFRVIFIDDGSLIPNNSIINNERKDFECLLLRLNKNFGQHTATSIGLSYCKAPLVATIDDDLQHDPFELSKLINHMESTNADLVFGTFNNKQHSFVRNIGSSLLKMVFKVDGVDYKSITSFRLMKLSVSSVFSKYKRPIVFIEEYLLKNSKKTESCPVSHNKRESGTSGYSYSKLFKFALKIVLFHSSLPLNFIVRFGILTAVICFFLGCYFIYQKLVFDSQLGYSSTIVSIFFSTGLVLMTLGIIGEYIRRIWIAQHNLDQVIIFEDKNGE